NRNRMTSKTIPGQQRIRFWYDRRDRLVLTRDGEGNQLCTKYDALNRPVMTVRHTGYSMPSSNDALYETETSINAFGYTMNNTFPKSNFEVLTASYYDHYDFDRNGNISSSETYQADASGEYTEAPEKLIQGLLTGSKIGYFKPGATNIEGYKSSKFYYDDHHNVLQSKNVNHTNQEEITYNSFDFNSLLIKTKTLHRASINSLHSKVINKEFEYDHRGNLLQGYLQIDNGDKHLLFENRYNERNLLSSKKLGKAPNQDDFLQNINYAYNIRGWITKINNVKSSCGNVYDPVDPIIGGGSGKKSFGESAQGKKGAVSNTPNDLFSMELFYSNIPSVSGMPSNSGRFDGCTAGIMWQSGCGESIQYYGFEYDNHKQLLDAYYAEGSKKTNVDYTARYDMHASYDLNGNINTIKRKESQTLIDDLLLSYDDNNQLTHVAEFSNFNKGFKTSTLGATYDFDLNGNLSRDNHHHYDVHYNHLNLPHTINYDSEDSIMIQYDVVGTKLAKYTKPVGAQKWTIKRYFGGIEYLNDDLEAIYHNEGRVTPQGNHFQYEYTLKDHLGNTRITFADLNTDGKISKSDGEILQENHYYPFGMQMEGNWNAVIGAENQYTYNGKELNTEFGLNWLDYGARWYDPSIARWNAIDPLAEEFLSWTPYHYVHNNPANLIDPNGKDTAIYQPIPVVQQQSVESSGPKLSDAFEFYIEAGASGEDNATGSSLDEGVFVTLEWAGDEISIEGGREWSKQSVFQKASIELKVKASSNKTLSLEGELKIIPLKLGLTKSKKGAEVGIAEIIPASATVDLTTGQTDVVFDFSDSYEQLYLSGGLTEHLSFEIGVQTTNELKQTTQEYSDKPHIDRKYTGAGNRSY
ncbi:MAG: RHS repeat-associated core domain-containing protein, partial [Flavobacteriales bacterium]|nr:RHS repeat-associated core domain-containing protein [Flavobacteriales bacterium]